MATKHYASESATYRYGQLIEENIARLEAEGMSPQEAKLKGDTPDPNDFKPKFTLKVDNKAVYVHAQNVINVFRDLNLNNLNFITSAEKAPK